MLRGCLLLQRSIPRIPPIKFKYKGGTYEGATVNGIPDGMGIFTDRINRRYSGIWVCGKLKDKSIIEYPDGSRYKGTVINYQRIGNGVFTDKDRSIWNGSWSNNSPHGKFSVTYPSLGNFHATLFEGQVTYFKWASEPTEGLKALMNRAISSPECEGFFPAFGLQMVLEKELLVENNQQVIDMLQNAKYINELSTPDERRKYLRYIASYPNNPHLLMTLVGDHAVCVIFKGNRVIMCNGGAGSDSAIEDTYKLIWNGITDFLFRKGQVFKVFQLTENIEDTQYQLLEKFYKGVKMEVSSESFDDIYLKDSLLPVVSDSRHRLSTEDYPFQKGGSCWYYSVKLAAEGAKKA